MYSNGARHEFTETEDKHLIEYIATENPGATKRTGNKLYEKLVENAEGKWPWSKTHGWMSWRERYKKNQESFDKRIRRYQRNNGIEVPEDDKVKKTQASRTQFTDKEDKLLVAYIAKMNPGIKGRLGNKLYDTLVEDEEGKWPWSQTHTSMAWRQRYKLNQEWFNEKIRIYQEKRGIQSTIRENETKRKRKPDDSDDERERKRAKEDKAEECYKEPKRSARDKQEESSTTRNNRQPKKPKTAAPPAAKDEISGPTSKPVSSRVQDSDQGIPNRIKSAPLPKIPEDRVAKGKGKGKAEVIEVTDTDDDEEDEVPRGPVGSDDYRGDIYAEGEPEDDSELAAEVDAMLTDTADMSNEEIEQSPVPEYEPDEQLHLQPLDSPLVLDDTLEISRTPWAASKEGEDRGVLDLSQEPTPPLSTIDDMPHEIEKREEQIKSSSKSTKLTGGGGSDSPLKARTKEGSGTSLVVEDTRTSKPTEGAARGKPQLKPLASLLKRKQSEAEDPFGPSPPTPNSEQESRRPVRKRQVPILEESAFTNKFKGTRRSLFNTDTETDSNDSEPTGKPIAVWPPIRGRHDRAKVQSIALPWGSADIIKDIEKPVETNRMVPPTTFEPLVDGQAIEEHSPVKPPAKQASRVQVNVVASSSRKMLPPREPSAPTLFRADTSEAQRAEESGWQGELITPNDSTLIEPEIDSAAKRVAVVLARKSIGTDTSMSGNGFCQDIEQKVSLPISLPTSDTFQPPRPQSPLSDDPFIDSPFKKKGNRRGNEELAGPRINLHSEVEKQQRHSRLSSVSSASRKLRRASRETHSMRASSVLSIPLPEEELSVIHELGLKEMISRIARKHGFAEEVVWNVFKKSGTITNTENVIMIMKRHAEEAATKALEQIKGIPVDDDEEQEKDDMEVENATPERSERSERAEGVHSRNRPSGKTGQLLIKPLVEDDHMSDYSPPISSRAGKYVRLAERGREDEAVERERKRASLGYSVSRLLPAVREPEESPTKNGKHSLPMPQMIQASRLPSPKEPEPPKFMELTDEVKEKFKTASRENIDELHELEKVVDPKALMDWFVGYMRELRVKPEPED